MPDAGYPIEPRRWSSASVLLLPALPTVHFPLPTIPYTTLERSSSLILDPLGRQRPCSKSCSETAPPTIRQPLKTGCRCMGFQTGRDSMFCASRARRMSSRVAPNGGVDSDAGEPAVRTAVAHSVVVADFRMFVVRGRITCLGSKVSGTVGPGPRSTKGLGALLTRRSMSITEHLF